MYYRKYVIVRSIAIYVNWATWFENLAHNKIILLWRQGIHSLLIFFSFLNIYLISIFIILVFNGCMSVTETKTIYIFSAYFIIIYWFMLYLFLLCSIGFLYYFVYYYVYLIIILLSSPNFYVVKFIFLDTQCPQSCKMKK